MKKFFKTALIAAAFAFVVFAVDANTTTLASASGGSSSDNDVSANVTVGDKTITVTVKEGSNVTKVEVAAPTETVKAAFEQQVNEALDDAAVKAEVADGKKYEVPAGATVTTVEITVTRTSETGDVTITLADAAFVQGHTYLVMHQHGDDWDYQVCTVETAGELDATFANFSPVGYVRIVEVVDDGDDETPVSPTPGAGTTNRPSPTPGNNNTSSANSSSRPASSGVSASQAYFNNMMSLINNTPVDGVITLTKDSGRNALDMIMVKKLVEKNITLVMEYTYNGVDYRIVIPGNQAVYDENIPIYGPLYLAAHYSSDAVVGNAGTVTYTIVKGDTLSRIAAKNGTTVAALAALNPQITNVNVIYTGQSINLK